MRAASIRYLNPLQLLSRNSTSYESLPGYDFGGNGTPSSPGPSKKKARFLSTGPGNQRFRWAKTLMRIAAVVLALILIFGVFGGSRYKRKREDRIDEDRSAEEHANTRYWEVFPRLNGFFLGVKTLVPWSEWVPEDLQTEDFGSPSMPGHYEPSPSGTPVKRDSYAQLPLTPKLFSPYPDYKSSAYLANHSAVHTCYLDEEETQAAPDIFVYNGVPQHMTAPYFGSHQELGLAHDVCFERFGRLGPYGYGYNAQEGGLGLGMRSEQQGAEVIWNMQPKIDYRYIDWGAAQAKCFEKNKARFASIQAGPADKSHNSTSDSKLKVSRTAYVLRTWTGFEYTAHEVLALRSMISELSLKSGGEYDIHLLLHVKDDTIPIWTSPDVYRSVIEENIPQEFWNITTLWSVQLMRMYYPGPFGEPPANIAGQEIHGVYRSAHFALQWFSQEHPEYDYVWNWEMDMRYSGHHYEFHNGVGEWAARQPRRGLWERNEKFYIPAYHGSWSNFTAFVDSETLDNGQMPVWGPVTFPNSGMLEPPEETHPPRSVLDDNFEWGVGEEADLITFNPIFDPAKTNWVFRKDISGYDLNLPIPPRRCAIVTVARLSRRLLNMMHEETYIGKHSAFPEMWPPTVALHHGFKAVYIPHPVYFDRKWPLDYMDQVFNYPENKINSPFGWGEHNWLGTSFYYNSGFSGALWRRWLGERENDEGGAQDEIDGTGRMCLRSTLHHPIKNEDMPEQ